MAKLKYIVIHCTATPEGREVTPEDIRQWHQVQRGWKQVGYTYLIQLDGNVCQLVENNNDSKVDPWEVTNGVRGFNSISLHIAYAGGCHSAKAKSASWYQPKDTRTPEQLKALETLVKDLIKLHDGVKVCGHNQLANKACPSFNVPEWCENIELPKRNIYNP